MSIKRLIRSIARDLLPCAELDFHTQSGLHLFVPDRGAWSSASETFFRRIYGPFYPHLSSVRNWVDLGCNNGFFSFWLLDQIRNAGQALPETHVYLGDANEACVSRVLKAIVNNQLQAAWNCEQVVIGPPNTTIKFKHHKDSLGSNIFGQGRSNRVLLYDTTDITGRLEKSRNLFDLIKIDIEGAEKFLFSNHLDFIKRFHYGLCEWHAPTFSGVELQDRLATLGWRVLEVRSQGVEYDLSQANSWKSPMGMALWENLHAIG